MKRFALLAATAVIGLGAPASAAVVITEYDLTFVAGTGFITSAQTAPGEYQDVFKFTTTEATTFSGSLSTQRLRDLSGGVVSDLDFGNTLPMDGVHLDDTYFILATGGSDELEVQDLPTTLLLPGDHKLVVNYTVQTANAVNAAAYAGPLFLSSAVPEPGTWAMAIFGIATVGGLMRRKQNVRVSFT